MKAGRERSLARKRRKGRCRFPLPRTGLGSSPRPARPRPPTGSSESAGSRLRLLSLRALLGFCKKGRLPWPQMGAGRAFRRAAQLTRFCKRPARLAWRSRPGTKARQGPKAAIWGQGCGEAGDGHPCPPPAFPGSACVALRRFQPRGRKTAELLLSKREKGAKHALLQQEHSRDPAGMGSLRGPTGLRKLLKCLSRSLSLYNAENCSSRGGGAGEGGWGHLWSDLMFPFHHIEAGMLGLQFLSAWPC